MTHKFSDLDAKHRLIALRAMLEGVNAAVTTQCKQLAYNAYRQYYTDGTPFTIEQIWSRVRYPQHEHFSRSGNLLKVLEDAISSTEKEVAGEVPNEAPISQKTEEPQPKKTKSKKKTGD
jgi:hypothetical protein